MGDAKFCPRCGAHVAAGARFCSSCGADLPEMAGGQRPASAGGAQAGKGSAPGWGSRRCSARCRSCG
ncbi:zinc ribbon domain-containing protein [Collinsella tanakaei]|uniref:zinc-ribbon domain-containing protein n=1 Tax=Collinsella tanakaei TaxID=626935 RepID=UPI00195E2222|nr:zinc ribbon domain-containing protein [Collinsella tanakaei]